jgi:putative ABC transport system permease protein
VIAPGVLLRLAARGLLVHKLRSTLSILGVVCGVAAVVAMSSVGLGARREAEAQLGALGIDSVTVRARAPRPGEPQLFLQLRDADHAAAVVPHLLALAPVRETSVHAELSGRRASVNVVGTTPGYARAARLPLAAGRFLADLDVRDRKRTAVLGAAVARQLVPLGDALGAEVRMLGGFYRVVGVLEDRAAPRLRATPIRTRDVNRSVFVPLPALDASGPQPDAIDEIVLRVEAGEHVDAAAQVTRAALQRTAKGVDLELLVPREILRQRQRTQRIFDVVTGAVAVIGLFAGGIGIMNIMLASVAERTEEIGVRRAVGATKPDVAAQFLVESSLLTVAGGALGALLGILGAVFIQSWAGWPTALSPAMLLVALLMAAAVGVGFGFYPAWRAAQLEPMEALRWR